MLSVLTDIIIIPVWSIIEILGNDIIPVLMIPNDIINDRRIDDIIIAYLLWLFIIRIIIPLLLFHNWWPYYFHLLCVLAVCVDSNMMKWPYNAHIDDVCDNDIDIQ